MRLDTLANRPRAILRMLEAGLVLFFCDVCGEVTAEPSCCGAPADRLRAREIRETLEEDERREAATAGQLAN